MRCPLCDVAMKEVVRRGVRIDVCPECRGVWLDRGEMEKLLAAEPQGLRDDPGDRYGPPPGGHGYGDRHGYGHGYGHGHKKKKGWLSEIFDFD